MHDDAILEDVKRIVDSLGIGRVYVRVSQNKARGPIWPADNCGDCRLRRFQNTFFWGEASYKKNFLAPGPLRMPSISVQSVVYDGYRGRFEHQPEAQALRDSRADRDDRSKTPIVATYPPASKQRAMTLEIMPMVDQRYRSCSAKAHSRFAVLMHHDKVGCESGNGACKSLDTLARGYFFKVLRLKMAPRLHNRKPLLCRDSG